MCIRDRFISLFADLVARTSPELPRQIANAHTIFNVAVSLMLFPFVQHVAHLVQKLAPDEPVKRKQKVTAYIDPMQYAVPAVAITEAGRELARLGEVTAEMIELSCGALLGKNATDARRVLALEDEVVDPVTNELENFVNNLLLGELNQAQHKRAFQIKNLLIDVYKRQLLPGESHGVSRGGRTDRRIARLEVMLGWFEKYLK